MRLSMINSYGMSNSQSPHALSEGCPDTGSLAVFNSLHALLCMPEPIVQYPPIIVCCRLPSVCPTPRRRPKSIPAQQHPNKDISTITAPALIAVNSHCSYQRALSAFSLRPFDSEHSGTSRPLVRAQGNRTYARLGGSSYVIRSQSPGEDAA